METKYCSNCGSKISQEFSFCGNCGEKIGPVAIEKNSCPGCGYVGAVDEKYCPECGTGLTLAKSEEKPPKSPPKPVEKKKPGPVAKTTITPSVKKKKGGILRTLGKVALWIFGFLIIAVVGLYFLGDSPDDSYAGNEQQQERLESNIPGEEMKLPPVKIRQANAVLTNEVSFPLVSSSEEQVFDYNDSLRIRIPPNFVSKKKTLSISQAKVDSAIMVEDAIPLMMLDLTLNNGEQPLKPLVYSYKYNPTVLNPNYTAEEQLIVARWDEEYGVWINLPILIDEDQGTISTLVDHFSISVIAIIKGVGLAVGAGVVISTTAEEALNSVYVTPNKNFRILYSKDDLEEKLTLDDQYWDKSVIKKYKKEVPKYVQVVGYYLEEALESYTKVYNFKNPAGLYSTINKSNKLLKLKSNKSFHKMVTVKLNSYLSRYKGLPFYESIFGAIHIPNLFSDGVKSTAPHELFHTIQAEYYGIPGMLDSDNQWWLEATAEYAAFNFAWFPPLDDMGKGIGSNYLTFPVTSRGKKEGHGWWGREYEYFTSIWIQYLVDNENFDFKEMIEYDAKDNLPSISSLENYSRKTQNQKLEDVYRRFTKWMTFSSNSPLKKYPLASFDTRTKYDKIIATAQSELKLGSGKDITHTFELPGHYSSKLWAIKVKKDPLDKKNEGKAISIKAKSITRGIAVDVFVVAQDERFLTHPKPIKSIYTKDKSVIVFAKPNDLVLVAATQGSSTGGNAEVIVSDAGIILEIDPPELPNVKPEEQNYFAITAKNIPKEIEKVSFEWNYNDGTEKGFHDFVDVTNGEAMQKISHSYAESDKEEIYPLKAILREAGKNTILSEAEALITLPLEGPNVFITERILVGPPGATFDMEALATPANTYKFVWQIDGMAEGYTRVGKKSGIAPIIDKIGEYTATVKLYDTEGTYLATDAVSISVEADNSGLSSSHTFNNKGEELFNTFMPFRFGLGLGSCNYDQPQPLMGLIKYSSDISATIIGDKIIEKKKSMLILDTQKPLKLQLNCNATITDGNVSKLERGNAKYDQQHSIAGYKIKVNGKEYLSSSGSFNLPQGKSHISASMLVSTTGTCTFKPVYSGKECKDLVYQYDPSKVNEVVIGGFVIYTNGAPIESIGAGNPYGGYNPDNN